MSSEITKGKTIWQDNEGQISESCIRKSHPDDGKIEVKEIPINKYQKPLISSQKKFEYNNQQKERSDEFPSNYISGSHGGSFSAMQHCKKRSQYTNHK